MLLAVNKKNHLNCWNAFFEWNCVENVKVIRESLFRYAMVVVLSRAYGPPKKKYPWKLVLYRYGYDPSIGFSAHKSLPYHAPPSGYKKTSEINVLCYNCFYIKKYRLWLDNLSEFDVH